VMGPTHARELEQRLLLAAQAGDEHAFRALVEVHRSAIQAHCYRLLGALQDAEDAYQDTLLRAWRALDGFNDESRFGTWLYRIATNVCLSTAARQARRALPADLQPPSPTPSDGPDGWADGTRFIGPYPDAVLDVPSGYADPSATFDQRESIELAFVAALQWLPPRQRAALILSEVLGFRASEIAETLETTVASVTSALQRARARLAIVRPLESQQHVARAVGEQRLGERVEQFAVALEEGDTETLLQMLADDVTFQMPPHRDWVRGRAEVAASWLIPSTRPTRLRALPAHMNGQHAVAIYRADPGSGRCYPIALDLVGFRDDRIAQIVAFRSPESFAGLGLPASVALPGAA
jgi:RNA polymerase sigma-70 factor (ECF subfamily)